MSTDEYRVDSDAGVGGADVRGGGDARHTGHGDVHQHGYITDKERYLRRLRRIEGQARGIHKMIDEEVYCIDILTQISALTSAVEAVALGLLDDHLKYCVLDAARLGGDEAEAKIAEASAAIARLVR